MKKNIKAIDFFCGAGGMTFGLRKAGINVIAGIDNDNTCKETYEFNNQGTLFLPYDISKLAPEKLKEETKINQHDPNLLFIGCAPCQFWSKINTDKRKSELSKDLLQEFQRFVEYFNPGYAVIENVPGLKNNKNAKVRKQFLGFLKSKGYRYEDDIINVHDYGVPQNRKRYLIVASRVSQHISFPEKSTEGPFTVRDFIGNHNGFPKIKDGHKDKSNYLHTTALLSHINKARIKKTRKDGGTRISWENDSKLQVPAYKNKNNYFQDVYGRMFWDKPAPTITTRFNSLSNGRFGHPEENRAISLREGAILQTFPIQYIFKGNEANIARHIGNAVPPMLAEKLARIIH